MLKILYGPALGLVALALSAGATAGEWKNWKNGVVGWNPPEWCEQYWTAARAQADDLGDLAARTPTQSNPGMALRQAETLIQIGKDMTRRLREQYPHWTRCVPPPTGGGSDLESRIEALEREARSR